MIAQRWADAREGPVMGAVVHRGARVRRTTAHCHARGQLLGTEAGLVTVQAAGHHRVVPASDAVWIPPHASHAAGSHGPFGGSSVYVVPSARSALPRQPCVLARPLLRPGIPSPAHPRKSPARIHRAGRAEAPPARRLEEGWRLRGVLGHIGARGVAHPDGDQPAGCRAVLWIDEQIHDLNALAGDAAPRLLAAARDINDAGVITGNLTDAATGRVLPFVAAPRC